MEKDKNNKEKWEAIRDIIATLCGTAIWIVFILSIFAL